MARKVGLYAELGSDGSLGKDIYVDAGKTKAVFASDKDQADANARIDKINEESSRSRTNRTAKSKTVMQQRATATPSPEPAPAPVSSANPITAPQTFVPPKPSVQDQQQQSRIVLNRSTPNPSPPPSDVRDERVVLKRTYKKYLTSDNDSSVLESEEYVTFSGDAETRRKQKEVFFLSRDGGYDSNTLFFDSEGKGFSADPTIVKREQYLASFDGTLFKDSSGKGFSANPDLVPVGFKNNLFVQDELVFASGKTQKIDSKEVFGVRMNVNELAPQKNTKKVSFLSEKGNAVFNYVDEKYNAVTRKGGELYASYGAMISPYIDKGDAFISKSNVFGGLYKGGATDLVQVRKSGMYATDFAMSYASGRVLGGAFGVVGTTIVGNKVINTKTFKYSAGALGLGSIGYGAVTSEDKIGFGLNVLSGGLGFSKGFSGAYNSFYNPKVEYKNVKMTVLNKKSKNNFNTQRLTKSSEIDDLIFSKRVGSKVRDTSFTPQDIILKEDIVNTRGITVGKRTTSIIDGKASSMESIKSKNLLGLNSKTLIRETFEPYGLKGKTVSNDIDAFSILKKVKSDKAYNSELGSLIVRNMLGTKVKSRVKGPQSLVLRQETGLRNVPNNKNILDVEFNTLRNPRKSNINKLDSDILVSVESTSMYNNNRFNIGSFKSGNRLKEISLSEGRNFYTPSKEKQNIRIETEKKGKLYYEGEFLGEKTALTKSVSYKTFDDYSYNIPKVPSSVKVSKNKSYQYRNDKYVVSRDLSSSTQKYEFGELGIKSKSTQKVSLPKSYEINTLQQPIYKIDKFGSPKLKFEESYTSRKYRAEFGEELYIDKTKLNNNKVLTQKFPVSLSESTSSTTLNIKGNPFKSFELTKGTYKEGLSDPPSFYARLSRKWGKKGSQTLTISSLKDVQNIGRASSVQELGSFRVSRGTSLGSSSFSLPSSIARPLYSSKRVVFSSGGLPSTRSDSVPVSLSSFDLSSRFNSGSVSLFKNDFKNNVRIDSVPVSKSNRRNNIKIRSDYKSSLKSDLRVNSDSMLMQEQLISPLVMPQEKVINRRIITPRRNNFLVVKGGTLPRKLSFKGSSRSVPKLRLSSSFDFVSRPRKFDILPSLREVFVYEALTGKEARKPRKTKAIKSLFESQYFGRGNFNVSIPVFQNQKI